MIIASAPTYQDDASQVRLEALGLAGDQLRWAVERGEIERQTCTPNDPTYVPGILAQGRTVRFLREVLIPLGWERRDIRNLPLVVDPKGEVAITVATGDEGTGMPGQPVSTKYPKGSATADFVQSNQLRLDVGVDERAAPRLTTWVLLFRRTRSEIRLEVSLPQTITNEGKIIEWEERIMLRPIALGEVGEAGRSAGPEPEPPVSFEVEPRVQG